MTYFIICRKSFKLSAVMTYFMSCSKSFELSMVMRDVSEFGTMMMGVLEILLTCCPGDWAGDEVPLWGVLLGLLMIVFPAGDCRGGRERVGSVQKMKTTSKKWRSLKNIVHNSYTYKLHYSFIHNDKLQHVRFSDFSPTIHGCIAFSPTVT